MLRNSKFVSKVNASEQELEEGNLLRKVKRKRRGRKGSEGAASPAALELSVAAELPAASAPQEQPMSAFSTASPYQPASQYVAEGPPASEDVAAASEFLDLPIASVSPDLLIPVCHVPAARRVPVPASRVSVTRATPVPAPWPPLQSTAQPKNFQSMFSPVSRQCFSLRFCFCSHFC